VLRYCLRALAALLIFLAGASGAYAHEFWMLPDRFEAAPGSTVNLRLYVGQNFTGDQVGISAPLVAAFGHYAAGTLVDLKGEAPATAMVGSLPVRLPRAGTHLLAMDSHPSPLQLAPDLFKAYLELEGLQGIIEARERAGTSSLPSRERFRRNIKALIQVGGQSDTTYATRTGQRLEIVPLQDPATADAGTPLGFQVYFDSQPLTGALVKFWSRSGSELVALSQRTDNQGEVSMALPAAGVWMVSLVHMIPTTDSSDFDWDSYWGNLIFALRPSPKVTAR
jgi:uncharacterized GH25 family protein